MIKTKEAIELTIDFAKSVRGAEEVDGYLDFTIDRVVKNISMQAEYLENVSRALVTEAEQLKVDVKTRLLNCRDC